MGLDPTKFALLGKLLLAVDSANCVAILALLSVCNSLLATLRVLWFAVFCTCTWYCVFIACMFIHIHIGKYFQYI
jgi:hypothetical protein